MLELEKKAWKWLVVSSSDPTKVSLMVKGILVGVLPFLLNYLPLLGVHVSPDFQNLPDTAYGIVFWALSLVAGIMAFIGFVRKMWNTFFPAQDV